MQRNFKSDLTGCICIFFLLLHSTHSFRCREQPISCFECDSRYQPNCADPFHHYAVLTSNCQGCCTKSTFLYPTYYVVRSCADFRSSRIFGFDLSCEEKSSRERKCYCNEPLCNTANPLNKKAIYLPLLTTIVFFQAYIIRQI